MEDNAEDGSESEMVELRLKVQSLKHELQTCKAELAKLQKQLSNSERLQKSTEGYNDDLRKQVERLSAEIHERKKKDKERADAETQTEEYTWTETDYYNYYYGNYQNAEVTETQENATLEGSNKACEVTADMAKDKEPPDLSNQQASNTDVSTEKADGGSIADMLRATAEEAMTQTGFVFDETTGMYYDHSTGFYYDSASQLYYDANTGMYYYYDAESGRYQFHSRIELPAGNAATDPCPDTMLTEKKVKRSKKGTGKSTYHENKDTRVEAEKLETDDLVWEERRTSKRGTAQGRLRHRSSSPDSSPRRKGYSKHRKDSSRESSTKRKKQKRSTHSDDTSDSKRKKKRKKLKSENRRKGKKKKKKNSVVKGEDSSGDSEPEEGEITASDGDLSTPSFSSSSFGPSSPSRDSPVSEMEAEDQEAKEVWPPCVRVIVVRSPVLQVGTLFIITADSPATIGREKDMDHAVRIPEVGVSKFHAEVYFDQDQQGYMLVDQGSQNGTVINGNRILQPKTKCDPYALMHGDEVKMGDTVLSFHIHPGTDTCDGCEPGQVMAHLSKHKREEKAGPAPTKEDKEVLRQKELKQMKVKYGLKSSEYEEAKALKNPKYKDRAESRRQKVGSEGTFQRDDAPASVHVEISEVNKGRKMLEKMGWKRGEGLGKDGAGITDPIELKIRKSQSGLGAGAAVSADDASLTRSKNQRNWEKARERFADQSSSKKEEKGRSPTSWVKAEGTE